MPVFAYFGPAGTFTEMALQAILSRHDSGLPFAAGDQIDTVALSSPTAVIAAVRAGDVDFGCVPIESSLEGAVPATMDALVTPDGDRRVQAYTEVALDITFTIAAAGPMAADAIQTIAAYPVASAQVRSSVAAQFPNAQFVIAASNAAAAADVANGSADAAVTTAAAARMYGLTPLAENVADSSNAITRFLLLGPPGSPPPRTGSDRTSVIVDLPNVPGSLVAAIGEFATRGIDLTRIESRPRGADNYRFYLDSCGHISDAAVGEALRALYRTAEHVTYLGSWRIDPRAPGLPSAPPDHTASTEWFSQLENGDD